MKKELADYIANHRLIQIATASEGKPWICTVFYAFDGKNLYFISKPNRRHSLDIKKNKNVACAITDSGQVVSDKKVGVQIQGIAAHLKTDKEIRMAFDLWNKANPGIQDEITLENFKKGKIKDVPYIIRPTEIKFFNENKTEVIKIFKIGRRSK